MKRLSLLERGKVKNLSCKKVSRLYNFQCICFISLLLLFCFLQKQTVAFHGAFSLLLQCLENLAGEVEQLTLQGGKLALKVFKAITIIQEKRSVTVEVFTVLWYSITPGGGGALPMMAYTGRLRPKGIPLLGFRCTR